MGRTVEDVEIACRVVFGSDSINYDPAPIPYRDASLPEKLKFGFYTEGQPTILLTAMIALTLWHRRYHPNVTCLQTSCPRDNSCTPRRRP